MNAAEIRRQYLSFFARNGHEIVSSSPLVPHNDPSLYFTNAGMVQFKDVFTGQEVRNYTRATTSQKCLRVSGKHNDLENVGRTPRHHTFFEMLGNFSFGDYFKRDAIRYAWEFLTGDMQIDPNRLWVTIYEQDDEAYDLWRGEVGFPAARIQRLGAKDNFWSMGDTGPCGPCTEIHYDHGPAISSEEGGPATENPRYVEIWNLVFMQFEQHADKTRTNLPRPSIDTGMGLERLCAVKQGVYSNYDTDLFLPLIRRGAIEAGVSYGSDAEKDVALRVIADHARATTFLVADGVMPSNEARGYVLRRIMRRAIRFGVKLGFERPFFHLIADEVIRNYAAAYPELGDRRSFIEEIILSEEERFRRTLDRGMKLLDAEIERTGHGGTLPGDVVFKLSDTFGFPADLTRLIAEERSVNVDEAGFETELAKQKALGRANWKGSGEQAIGALWHGLAGEHGATKFSGYDRDEDTGTVVAIIRKDGDDYTQTDRLEPGEKGIVLLDRTPFYAESGGQQGDSGRIEARDTSAFVGDTTKASGLHLHHVHIESGALTVGEMVRALADGARRDQTRRNHSGTHLLHAALRNVLGEHVTQKGSLVGPDRLRFDFAHHKAMTAAELAEVERQVNAEILKNTGVNTRLESLEHAKGQGAMALFGEKYDDVVRVVEVPGFSLELCGGTHVRRTGDIGFLKITAETGIAAGVRRIEAQTGTGAAKYVDEQLGLLDALARRFKTSPHELSTAIDRLADERKNLEKELAALHREIAKAAAGKVLDRAIDLGGVKLLVAELDGDLKEQADRLRDQLGSSVVILGQKADDKAVLVAAASKDVAGKVHAGKLIQEIAPLVGGKGGGRPDMAQAGGPSPEGLAAALARATEIAQAALG